MFQKLLLPGRAKLTCRECVLFHPREKFGRPFAPAEEGGENGFAQRGAVAVPSRQQCVSGGGFSQANQRSDGGVLEGVGIFRAQKPGQLLEIVVPLRCEAAQQADRG